MNKIEQKPELVVCAGHWESISSAIHAGANAVYFGIKEFNLRINARSFERNEIAKVVETCHANDVKAYLTLNSIVYDTEKNKVQRIVEEAKCAGVDAIICWDMGVVKTALSEGLNVHLSTQASVSNFQALLFYYEQGIRRFVLARECTIEMIAHIATEVKKHALQCILEVFIHGAMCVSVSGRCFISEYLFNRSANRGDCLQPCRRKYRITDIEEQGTLEIEDGYVLSPRDVCTISFLDRIIEAGVGALKIEGRTRPAEYVKVVTECYRCAIDAIYDGGYTQDKKNALYSSLDKVYNRGFSNGFYFGRPLNDLSEKSGSVSERKKIYIGDVIHFYQKINVAEILLRNSDVKVGDTLLISGKKTGAQIVTLNEMEKDHVRIDCAEKGAKIAMNFGFRVRKNDKIFLLIDVPS